MFYRTEKNKVPNLEWVFGLIASTSEVPLVESEHLCGGKHL
jgi:hypothetical protein